MQSIRKTTGIQDKVKSSIFNVISVARNTSYIHVLPLVKNANTVKSTITLQQNVILEKKKSVHVEGVDDCSSESEFTGELKVSSIDNGKTDDWYSLIKISDKTVRFKLDTGA